MTNPFVDGITTIDLNSDEQLESLSRETLLNLVRFLALGYEEQEADARTLWEALDAVRANFEVDWEAAIESHEQYTAICELLDRLALRYGPQVGEE